jgi:hypothetical protein
LIPKQPQCLKRIHSQATLVVRNVICKTIILNPKNNHNSWQKFKSPNICTSNKFLKISFDVLVQNIMGWNFHPTYACLLPYPLVTVSIVRICTKKSTFGHVYWIVHFSYAKIMFYLNIGVGFTQCVQKMCLG